MATKFVLSKDALEKLFELTRTEVFELKEFFLKGEPEKRLLLFYALGYLSDNYSQMSEDALKKKKDYEANHFSQKASEVLQTCDEIFDESPEREYYRELEYKIPKWAKFKTPIEQIQEVAKFCALNLPLDPDVLSNTKLLTGEIQKFLKDYKVKTGVESKYLEVLSEKFRGLREKPAKMSTLYEMLMLLDNVNQVIAMMEEEKKKSKKEPIAGFRTKK